MMIIVDEYPTWESGIWREKLPFSSVLIDRGTSINLCHQEWIDRRASSVVAMLWLLINGSHWYLVSEKMLEVCHHQIYHVMDAHQRTLATSRPPRSHSNAFPSQGPAYQAVIIFKNVFFAWPKCWQQQQTSHQMSNSQSKHELNKPIAMHTIFVHHMWVNEKLRLRLRLGTQIEQNVWTEQWLCT